MAIPLLDLKQQYAVIKEEALRVTEEVYESQIFILGKRVDDFERDFAAYCHSDFAIGLSSGTDALLIALMVLDLKPGDEVIVPAYSFFATAGVVDRLGAVPVFVDVEEESFNVSVKAIEEAITPKTRAIIPVHLYGQVAAMDEINALAAKQGIEVIEDAAQAVGAEYDGKRAGALSRFGCFSFFPSKNLGAFGDAGAVTTSDPAIKEKLLDYRVHGMRPKYYHKYVGGNFRIDALQAAILHVKLPHLDHWTEGRQRNAEIYRELVGSAGIGDRMILPKTLPKRRHVYNQFVVRFAEGEKRRDEVMTALKAAQIGCEIYYPLTLADQECFKHLPSAKKPLTVSRMHAQQSLALPIFPELTRDQITEVVETIAKAMA